MLFEQLSFASDSDFWISIVNILKFTVVVVIGEAIIALTLPDLKVKKHHETLIGGQANVVGS